MKEKTKSPRSLPPRSVPFSFKVKKHLLEMTFATTAVEDCLKALNQDTQSTQQDLTDKAERFHSLTYLNLPVLYWMVAAQELTEAEEENVETLQERVRNLADSLSQEPLKHRQANSEEEFNLIREVGDILEAIEPSLEQERRKAIANAASAKEKAEEEEHKQWVRGIKGNVISGAIGSILTLIVGILVKLLFF